MRRRVAYLAIYECWPCRDGVMMRRLDTETFPVPGPVYQRMNRFNQEFGEKGILNTRPIRSTAPPNWREMMIVPTERYHKFIFRREIDFNL